MTQISIVFIAFVSYIVIRYLMDIKKQLSNQEQANKRMLDSVAKQLDRLCAFCEKCDNTYSRNLSEIARALEEICNSLNQTYTTAGKYMDFASTALQHTLVCLRPFVDNSLKAAVDREDYIAAQECQRILTNLDMIINFTYKTNDK